MIGDEIDVIMRREYEAKDIRGIVPDEVWIEYRSHPHSHYHIRRKQLEELRRLKNGVDLQTSP